MTDFYQPELIEPDINRFEYSIKLATLTQNASHHFSNMRALATGANITICSAITGYYFKAESEISVYAATSLLILSMISFSAANYNFCSGFVHFNSIWQKYLAQAANDCQIYDHYYEGQRETDRVLTNRFEWIKNAHAYIFINLMYPAVSIIAIWSKG